MASSDDKRVSEKLGYEICAVAAEARSVTERAEVLKALSDPAVSKPLTAVT